jgi:hypothetical protein
MSLQAVPVEIEARVKDRGSCGEGVGIDMGKEQENGERKRLAPTPFIVLR